MIRILLFLRAWMAEMSLSKQGLRWALKMEPHLNSDALHLRYQYVRRLWGDFARGYVQDHD
jgi:hypothetical protein